MNGASKINTTDESLTTLNADDVVGNMGTSVMDTSATSNITVTV